MSCVQVTKHSRALPVGSMGTVLCVSMSLLGYLDISGESWTALRGHHHPHSPCREPRLGWKETSPQKAEIASSPQKTPLIHQGTELLCDKCGQPQCGTWGLVGGVSTTIRCSAPHSTQCSPESSEEWAEGQKLYKSAGHCDRTIHFSLEMGYWALSAPCSQHCCLVSKAQGLL